MIFFKILPGCFRIFTFKVRGRPVYHEHLSFQQKSYEVINWSWHKIFKKIRKKAYLSGLKILTGDYSLTSKKKAVVKVLNYTCIWRGTPGDEADVPATELPLTYQISTLSFPLHICRSRYNVSRLFLKGLFFASKSDSSGAGRRMAKFGTWATAL